MKKKLSKKNEIVKFQSRIFFKEAIKNKPKFTV